MITKSPTNMANNSDDHSGSGGTIVVIGGNADVITMQVQQEEMTEDAANSEEILLAEGTADDLITEEQQSESLIEEDGGEMATDDDQIIEEDTGGGDKMAEDGELDNSGEIIEADPKPQSSTSKKEEEFDLQQCRCCRSKSDLIDMFLEEDEEERAEPIEQPPPPPVKGTPGRKKKNKDVKLRICDKIMKICSGIRIYERDHLPKLICTNCVNKLKLALEFKETCETTDRELRKCLPRAKNKVRKSNSEFILIDYELSDDSGENEEINQQDDDEFKLSDVDVEESADSVDSDLVGEKVPKKRGRKPKKMQTSNNNNNSNNSSSVSTPGSGVKRGRGRPRLNPVVTPPAPKAQNIVYVTANASTDEEESDSEIESAPIGKKAKRGRPANKTEIVKSFCDFCNERFVSSAAYRDHQVRHEEFLSVLVCIKCHSKFPTRLDLKKHHLLNRCTKTLRNNCPTCLRSLSSTARLLQHLNSRCVPPQKKSVSTPKVSPRKESPASQSGRNLFKCVAPMTTTYWSDSFSD